MQNETKSQGFSGCRALALPLGEPHPFRVSLNGMGCITYGKPGKMCIYIPTHMNGKLNKRKISLIRYIRIKITNITQEI